MKRRVAREAALLLYSSQEKEYKQAKTKAAQTLRTRALPSNVEVAEELDKIGEELEGDSRKELLLQLRREAFRIMTFLKEFEPKLVGSVWRGTAHHSSDIDIQVFSPDHQAVQAKLQEKKFKVIKSEWVSMTKKGEKKSSFHIFLTLASGNAAEIVVKSLEKKIFERCEIYGDFFTGLSHSQLKRVLEENPLQKFVPT